MTYFNFTKIVPPNPNDPTANVASQINANWDEAERVLSAQMNGGAAVVNPEYGLEVIDYVNKKIQFYDGAAFQTAVNIDAGWNAWQPIAPKSPIAVRSGFTPRWRNHPVLRCVQIAGRVQNGTTPATFGTATFEISADTGNGVPDSMKPFGGQVVYNNSATAPISPSTTSATYLTVAANGTAGNNVKISGRFMGTSDGTSSLVLDNVQWWY